jgi:hypothetical protein
MSVATGSTAMMSSNGHHDIIFGPSLLSQPFSSDRQADNVTEACR